MAEPARRILLADADAFFVAVARMVDPEGAGKTPLLIVGGSRESRGVVCSASYETRKFGVRSAMPISRALRLCPDAMCVPVPRKACSEKSREIRRVLEQAEPVGRRLDFLLQEFNREANTLGSKSVDARTSAAAVELKVLIDQVREQIQNIE